MTLRPDHEAYLFGKRGLLPPTAKKYGLYSESNYIAIPIDGSVKAYVPDGDPKMWWPKPATDSVTPPFPSFDGLRECSVFVEGELDAMLASQELGIPVGSTTLGAKTWLDEWSDAVSSGQSEVTLLYDHDKSGDAGVKVAAASLERYGVRVKIARWPDDKPEGYDVTDHFTRGGTAAELSAILGRAEDHVAPGLALRATEFLAVDRGAQGHLIAGVLPSTSVGFIAGPPKSLKSFAATEAAFAVASGKSFLGRYGIEAQGRALIVQQESSWPAFQSRVRSAAKRYGMPSDLFILSNHGFNLQDEASVQKMEQEISRIRPKVMVIDPFAAFFMGNENSSQEIGQVVSLLRKWRDDYRTSICVVHHSNKESGHVSSARGGMRMRGSSALYGAAEFGVWMERTEDETANTSRARVELKEGEAPVPFEVRLEPTTCLLNVVGYRNMATPKEPQVYWHQDELDMIEVPF